MSKQHSAGAIRQCWDALCRPTSRWSMGMLLCGQFVSSLADMLVQFNGSYILAVAAYNAGPNAVSRWLNQNGDPRDEVNDPIDWIELIPFQETRTYVQRVLGNLQVFRNRLQPDRMAITLDRDLRR